VADPLPDLDTVAQLIRDTAAAEILPRFRLLGSGDVREKGPGDLVTIADTEVERRLSAGLPAIAPGSVVLGEEAAAEDPSRLELLAGDVPVWVVDPVDGTANFARGQEGFAVIVAYVHRARLRAGWIYDPRADVMVMAAAGAGAWCAGTRLAVAGDQALTAMTGAAYGRAKAGPRAAQALRDSGRVGAVRNFGCSGIEYMEIARGRAHFSLHSRSLPWDHAAGMLITREAGGVADFLDRSAYDPRIIDRPVLAAASHLAWDTVAATVGPLA
jgi:fructose-1,6-bisphosphatase/inositol monophosphatase family enzyme